MSRKSESLKGKVTKNFSEFSKLADFSLMNSLNDALTDYLTDS